MEGKDKTNAMKNLELNTINHQILCDIKKILEDNIIDRINELDLNIQYIYRRVKEIEKKEEEKSSNGGWIFS
tara:strand:+ start:1668 stop:1883 length:216 start_codon:yes stop_codon:yes gene_type:complete